MLRTSGVSGLQPFGVCWQDNVCFMEKLHKNVEHVMPTTVKMVQVDNDVSVSNQGCGHISN
jgi:hypothetical protein